MRTKVFLCLVCLAATALAQPVAPVLENSLGMKLVLIPAGEFMMGNHETAQTMQSSYPLQLAQPRLCTRRQSPCTERQLERR